jgi:acyl-CoA reductase-like NAD-dependent aldehyde dehydrogenase
MMMEDMGLTSSRNAGYILGFRAVTYAIAAGNTAILKGSETCPRVTWAIGKTFTDAGFPPGVINIITAHPEDASSITTQLIASPTLKKVNFTGSTNVGRIISKLCAEHIKPCLMELGGKAPAIVLDDADLKLAAKEVALGAFLNAGQICMATERVVVQKRVSKEFIEVFRETTGQIWPESHVLISKVSWEKNKKLVEDAKKKGAEVLFGDKDTSSEGQLRQYPIAFKGVTKEMDIYYTESFGPSISVLEVQTEEEALEIANDTEYGLSAAVFTKDLARGLKIAGGIESGAVHINSMSVHDEPNLPHGGTKSSGFGRFGSQGLEEWVRTKTITFPKW